MLKEKCNELINLLKNCFPTNYTINGEELFEYDLGYANDSQIIENLVKGKHWNDIDWLIINDEAVEAWMTPSYLKIEPYIQLFPSFLLDCLLDVAFSRRSLLSDFFIEWHLNIDKIEYEDKKKFLISLSDKKKTCIAKVLVFLVEVSHDNRLSKEALNSYWIKYL